ncbi:MAG: anaerobic ribonucleoside-triphosphate reductase activating protein [Clostridiales bacterium]|nr:anaerobic ribonucleoside-triphosphate reductase activating protein [Clostridiales bacterium]
MNYGEIKDCDIANGEGVRVSLFVSGCTHHCPNCFNQQTWDFSFGQPFTREVEDRLLQMLSRSYIGGLSLLGGEPFEPQNQKVLLPFLRRVKEMYPQKNIWCYSGYTLEELLGSSRAHTDDTLPMLQLIDILVDGRFVEALKDISLKFRGSSNQNVIDVKKTLASGEKVLYLQ